MRGAPKLRIDLEAPIADNAITRDGDERKIKPIKPFKSNASRLAFFRQAPGNHRDLLSSRASQTQVRERVFIYIPLHQIHYYLLPYTPIKTAGTRDGQHSPPLI